MSLALPKSTVQVIDAVPDNLRHPGLQLDKFTVPGDQTAQKAALSKVCAIPGDPQLLAVLLNRRSVLLGALPGATSFRCTTIAPLTLHLARASALENAGICFHPIYGFVYFPGSGLKGMARSFAETVWLPTQTDQKRAWRQIEDVFGWAHNPDRVKQVNNPDHPAQLRREDDSSPVSPEIKACCGNVVFHDAWPESWPKLMVDIVNNHHPEYYQAGPDDNAHPPGDWENPVPVYFLAVKPPITFTFPLAKRRWDVPDELLELARQWLLGALCHLGAGAKTAAGYGAFEPAQGEAPAPQRAVSATWQAAQTGTSARRAVFETTLELVTPAFLAGPNQQADDCDLRPATLRGLLRWWWRTMHAGYVDVKTLRALEAAVWGDTDSGGPVRITVQRTNDSPTPIPVPGKCIQKDNKNRAVLRTDPDFVKKIGLESPPNKKTAQGFLYLSYGMDEMPAGRPHERRHRFIMPPGAKWRVRLIARDGFYPPPSSRSSGVPTRLPASLILQQARAALWLLCHYGGVGSKGRNGYGSLLARDDSGDESKLEQIKQQAAVFRQKCGAKLRQQTPEIPSLNDALPVLSIPTPWKSYWFVLDQLGYAIQDFAQKHKRNWVKEALGLPRKIGISHDDGTRARQYRRESDRQTNQVVWLGQMHPYIAKRPPKDMRHAAPVHFHIAREPDGRHVIRVIAFPCSVLPDWHTSVKVLQDLLEHLKQDLGQRCQKNPQGPPPVAVSSVAGRAVQTSTKRAAGTPVQVKILAVRPKGGYDVQEEGKPQGTLTVGTPPAVAPQLGDIVQAEVHNDDPKCPQYRWPQAPKKSGGAG